MEESEETVAPRVQTGGASCYYQPAEQPATLELARQSHFSATTWAGRVQPPWNLRLRQPFVNTRGVEVVHALQQAEAIPVLKILHADLATVWTFVPSRIRDDSRTTPKFKAAFGCSPPVAYWLARCRQLRLSRSRLRLSRSHLKLSHSPPQGFSVRSPRVLRALRRKLDCRRELARWLNCRRRLAKLRNFPQWTQSSRFTRRSPSRLVDNLVDKSSRSFGVSFGVSFVRRPPRRGRPRFRLLRVSSYRKRNGREPHRTFEVVPAQREMGWPNSRSLARSPSVNAVRLELTPAARYANYPHPSREADRSFVTPVRHQAKRANCPIVQQDDGEQIAGGSSARARARDLLGYLALAVRVAAETDR